MSEKGKVVAPAVSEETPAVEPKKVEKQKVCRMISDGVYEYVEVE